MAIFVPRFVRQLRDVLLTAPADGEVLTYDSADEKWKNEAGGGGGGATTLSALTDVSGGPPAAGEAPVWDGDSFELMDVATQTELAAEAVLRVNGDAANVRSIAQVGHGLVVGDAVRFNGTAYVKALADAATNAEVVGLVSAVASANAFTLATGGLVTGLSGLTAGEVYFLSPSLAGALTDTEPTTTGQVSKPLLVADSTTSGYLFNFRGSIIGSAAGPEQGYQRLYGGNSPSTVPPETYFELPWILDPFNPSTETLFDLDTDPERPAAYNSGVYAVSITIGMDGVPQPTKGCFYDLELDIFGSDIAQEETAPLMGHGTSDFVLHVLSLTGYIPAGGACVAKVNHDTAGALTFYISSGTIQRLS